MAMTSSDSSSFILLCFQTRLIWQLPGWATHFPDPPGSPWDPLIFSTSPDFDSRALPNTLFKVESSFTPDSSQSPRNVASSESDPIHDVDLSYMYYDIRICRISHAACRECRYDRRCRTQVTSHRKYTDSGRVCFLTLFKLSIASFRQEVKRLDQISTRQALHCWHFVQGFSWYGFGMLSYDYRTNPLQYSPASDPLHALPRETIWRWSTMIW